MTGPLRISNNCQSSRYRSLSLERAKVKDEPTRPPRKVRFALPPPDVSTSRISENPENKPFSSRNTADSAGIFNINTEKHLSQRPNAKRIQLKEKQTESADEKFSLTRRFEKFRREHLQDRIRVFGEGVEVPVSVSPGVRNRVHPTGRYIRGTLSPTSNQAPHEPPVSPGGQALLRAARDGDDQTLREQLRRALAVGIPEEDLNATDSSGRASGIIKPKTHYSTCVEKTYPPSSTLNPRTNVKKTLSETCSALSRPHSQYFEKMEDTLISEIEEAEPTTSTAELDHNYDYVPPKKRTKMNESDKAYAQSIILKEIKNSLDDFKSTVSEKLGDIAEAIKQNRNRF